MFDDVSAVALAQTCILVWD